MYESDYLIMYILAKYCVSVWLMVNHKASWQAASVFSSLGHAHAFWFRHNNASSVLTFLPFAQRVNKVNSEQIQQKDGKANYRLAPLQIGTRIRMCPESYLSIWTDMAM